MTMSKTPRPKRLRAIRIEDELWERARRAARRQAVREDRNVTLSQWIREAIEQRLEREEDRSG